MGIIRKNSSMFTSNDNSITDSKLLAICHLVHNQSSFRLQTCQINFKLLSNYITYFNKPRQFDLEEESLKCIQWLKTEFIINIEIN